MITYNMHVNGASVRLANNEIEWKKTKGRRKIGIIKSSLRDPYIYTHNFNDHCYEYINCYNLKMEEAQKGIEHLFIEDQ